MLQTKKSRIERTRDTVVYLIAVLGVLLLIAARYIHDERLVLYGCVLLLVALIATGMLAQQWAVHHGLTKGIHYAMLHSKMEKSLNQALYDCGIYVERVVLFQKCAMVPEIKISIDDTLFKGIVTIENCIKYDKKLDELPIGSALQTNISLHRHIFQTIVMITYMSLNYIIWNNLCLVIIKILLNIQISMVSINCFWIQGIKL